MKAKPRQSVLMVCMGNICRSPTAEGVFRKMVREAGLEDEILIDSAGTHDYHVGAAPDTRARQTAAGRGYDLAGLVGRQVEYVDFERFDHILAMDRANLENLMRVCPREHQHKVRLFLSHGARFTGQEVPDPYYGGPQGFEQVLDMVEDAARGLLDEIRAKL